MTWPTGTPPTEHYDEPTDRPDLARDELLQLAQNFVTVIVNARSAASGIPSLDAGAKVPLGELPVVDVPRGGTGVATLTQHGILLGNAAAPVQVAAPGTAGQVMTSNGPGSAPTMQDAGGGVPLGACVTYFGNNEPAGYMWPDGRAISRTTYADLFTLFGTTYGAGDGTTTFNIPDVRGRACFGLDDMGTAQGAANRVTHANADVLGGTLGAESQTLVIANLAGHDHSPTTSGGRFRIFYGGAGWQNPGGGNNYTDDWTTNTVGSGQAFSIINPAIFAHQLLRVLP